MRGLPEHGHDPVMVAEVLGFLEPKPGQVVMDCTAGRGGHALAIAAKIAPGGTLVALDVDPENLIYTRKRFEESAIPGVALRTFHANFAEVADVLQEMQLDGVDGLLADLGVSTNQLTEARHGLSFNAAAPLDMRLDPRIKIKASDLIATLEEERLAGILHEFAQERFSRRIARKIVQTRAREPILTTEQLAALVRSVVPPARSDRGQIDPATRTFQALRMAVNSEMDCLHDLLACVPEIVLPGGRAAFISFHSGEDRLVKTATRQWHADGRCELLAKKPAEPGAAELARNSRSRSAKLRAVAFGDRKRASSSREPLSG